MNTDDRHLDRRQRDIDRRSRWVGRALIAGGLAALIVLLVCLSGPAAIASVVTAGAAVATAFIAWKSLTQLVDDSYQRTRPYVSLRVVPGVWGATAADLIVRNDGESMAYNVSIDFDDMTREGGPKDDKVLARIREYLVIKELYIPPHDFERYMWRFAPEAAKSEGAVYGMPTRVTATVSYNSARTKGIAKKEFNEEYLLSVEMHEAVPVPASGAKSTGSDRLHNIDEAIRALAVHVGQMRSR